MQVGLFDHIGRGDKPLATLFDERLSFYAAADRLGFYCMHLAEHHCSPINMAPSPSVFLGALARVTQKMRLGPLCYLLPLYTPLRMVEEICMLDHLSHGRFEVGIGRGVSPFEASYQSVDFSRSREVFIEAYECIRQGLRDDILNFEGEFYRYKDTPIQLKTFQEEPAFWYGSSNTVGATWAGEHGMHFTANGPTDFAKTNINAYKEALAKRGGPEVAKSEFRDGAAIGALRQIVVAETDAAARAIAEPAALKHHEEINWLRNRHGVSEHTARLNVPREHNFDGMMREGTVIAGSPKTVLAEIQRQSDVLGTNYVLGYMMFGDMQLDDALRSMQLFHAEVMPAIARM